MSIFNSVMLFKKGIYARRDFGHNNLNNIGCVVKVIVIKKKEEKAVRKNRCNQVDKVLH